MSKIFISEGRKSGFFALLTTVIRHLSQFKRDDSKFFVDWNKNNCLYYDINYGKNVWEYYFEQIDNINENEKKTAKIKNDCVNLINHDNLNVRQSFNFYFFKYIKFKDNIIFEINNEINKYKHYKKLGVHVRKTDKNEANKYGEGDMAKPLDDIYFFNVIDKIKKDYDKIFLATDCQNTYDMYKNRYGDVLMNSDRIRSKGNISIHLDPGYSNVQTNQINGFKKGFEALLDCVMLSNCNFLIKSTSNLSDMSMFINLNLECINLNEIYKNDFRGHYFNLFSKKESNFL